MHLHSFTLPPIFPTPVNTTSTDIHVDVDETGAVYAYLPSPTVLSAKYIDVVTPPVFPTPECRSLALACGWMHR